METYVILLRGVMPTGKNRVPMALLRPSLSHAGLHAVQTYIQSGNIIAQSNLDKVSLQTLVHDVIAREIGANITAVARTAVELATVLANNPFPAEAANRTYFSLLADLPHPSLADALQNLDVSPDAIHLGGDTLYTLYASQQSNSKYNNNFFERKLKVAATTRNFNTTSRLVALSSAH